MRIQLDQPQVVINTIRDVVNRVRENASSQQHLDHARHQLFGLTHIWLKPPVTGLQTAAFPPCANLQVNAR